MLQNLAILPASMSVQIIPKGGRLGLFAARKIKTNSLTSLPRWVDGSGSRCRWNSSNASPAKKSPDGRASTKGWTTLQVLGLSAIGLMAGFYFGTETTESTKMAYSNPAKLGGQPVYARIKQMEAVSHQRHIHVPLPKLRYPRHSKKFVKQ